MFSDRIARTGAAHLAAFALILAACGGRTSDRPTSPGCEGDSIFADPNVEEAVRTFLGQATGPLAAEDLARVTQLNVSGASSLEGVQCLEALEGLVAPDGNLADLAPLAGLQSLKSVFVERSNVRNLAALSDLPALQSIRASDNAITSLAGLSLPRAGCNYVLEVQRNSLRASDVDPYCALGWVVTWGGLNGTPIEQCNLICL